MGFIAPRGITTIAEGRDYLREIGQFIASSWQVTDARSSRIGGLPAKVFTAGTGTPCASPSRSSTCRVRGSPSS